jgi:DNA invertase Pin-like site-specific DNA recombinase
MLIGYTRVSTADPTLNSQEDDLRAAGCERIFTDVAIGSKTARPGLAEARQHRIGGTRVSLFR